MPWHAIDAVDDALDATRSFLFPFDLGRWARLALVVLFLGGGGNPFNVTNLPTGPATPPTGGPTLPPGTSDLVVGAVVVAVVLALVVFITAAVMRFVFLDALRTNEVRIRRPFRRRFGKGIRFLVFNVGVGLLVIASFLMVVVALTTGSLALFETIQSPNLRLGVGVLGSLLLGLLALAAVGAVVAFFHFTRAFVAPTMLAIDAGVMQSWGRFWTVLREHRWQFAVYMAVRLVLELAVAIATGLVLLLAGGLVVAVGVLVAIAISLAFGGFAAVTNSLVGVALLGFVALLTLLALFVCVLLPVRILAQTFVVSYELTVLGRVAPDLDLLANLGSRRDVAEGGAEAVSAAEPAAGEAGEGPSEESREEATEEPTGGFEFGAVESGESEEPGEPEEPGESTGSDGRESDEDVTGGGDEAETDTVDGEETGADGDSTADAADSDDDGDRDSSPYWKNP